MKAVVTAGGRIDGAFAETAGTTVKALAPIRGSTMLSRVLNALRGCGATRIAVIGGEEVRSACAPEIERFVDESSSGAENMLRALRAWPDDGEPLLYATSDLPYIESAAIEDFLARVPAGAIGLPLAENTDFCLRFPATPPTGITLASERVVNGGVFLLPAGSAERVATAAGGLFDARKRPWRMARLIGPLALLRFAIGRLSIAHLEAISLRILGMPARAVRGCAPELAFDVDGVTEYRYACEHR